MKILTEKFTKKGFKIEINSDDSNASVFVKTKTGKTVFWKTVFCRFEAYKLAEEWINKNESDAKELRETIKDLKIKLSKTHDLKARQEIQDMINAYETVLREEGESV